MEADEVTLHPQLGVGITESTSEYVADAALRVLNETAGQPFFMQINFTAPHDPLIPRQPLLDNYPFEQMPIPPSFAPEHVFDFGQRQIRDELLFQYPRTENEVQQEIARYYAVVEDLDNQIGRVLATLNTQNLMDNTLVIFASDQGIGLGSHGLRGKLNMYDHTISTPLIFSGPCVSANREIETQVYLKDVLPTAIDYASLEIPSDVQGVSALPLIEARQNRLHNYTFAYWGLEQRMVRTDDWKLIWYVEVDRVQLFDLQNDPFELDDRIDDPQFEEIRGTLAQALTQWQDENADPLTERLSF